MSALNNLDSLSKESWRRVSIVTPPKVVPNDLKVIENLADSIKNLEIKDVCGFCKKEFHIPKYCPEFQKFKDKCTPESKIFTYPKKRDIKGFCSAGVLIYTKYEDQIFLLMIRECRDNVWGLNFVGGKRDYRNETPKQCALREMKEELTECPIEVFDTSRQEKLRHLHLWYSKGRYFLIPMKVELSVEPSSNENFRWINIKNLGKEDLHFLPKELIRVFGLDQLNACPYN